MDTVPVSAALAQDPIGDELPGGTVLCHGQYTIQRYLNSGGFGVTYLALDSLGRKVAIKECYPGEMCWRAEGSVRLRSQSLETDFDRVVTLFEREARALAQLSHPNIVGVHQIFRDNGTAYMAMDFVQGPDLYDLMETAPEWFEPAEIVRILRALLHAMSYVHEHGILHRDISPDNILLDPAGTPILIDFGAAREDAARSTRILSRLHSVKDGYSPQEFYLAGSPQEKSSDLYALAATVYHMITGRPPPNSNVRLAAIAQDMPDPYVALSGKVAGFDAAFLASVDTCLNVFSKDRLASADDWLAAIEGRTGAPSPALAPVLSDTLHQAISELVSETSDFLKHLTEEPEPEPVVERPVDKSRDAERQYWSRVNAELEELRIAVERERAEQQAEEEEKQACLEEAARAEAAQAEVSTGQRRADGGGWFLSRWIRALTMARPKPALDALNAVEK